MSPACLPAGFFFRVLHQNTMTIISTAQTPEEFEENARLVSGDPTWSLGDSPSYPPVDDVINFFKGIDWSDVGSRIRVGTSNLLLFAMKFSEKSYDFHEYLYTRLNGMK